jgi:hypothetical protein
MKVEESAVESLREQLEKLPTRTTITPRELVDKLAPVIVAARARGQDYQAIAALLAGMGVRIKPSTVRNYLWRAPRVSATPRLVAPSNVPPIATSNSAPNAGASLNDRALQRRLCGDPIAAS